MRLISVTCKRVLMLLQENCPLINRTELILIVLSSFTMITLLTLFILYKSIKYVIDQADQMTTKQLGFDLQACYIQKLYQIS